MLLVRTPKTREEKKVLRLRKINSKTLKKTKKKNLKKFKGEKNVSYAL